MSTNHDDLLREANARLEELEEQGNNDLGDRITLDPGGNFIGRYRGELTMFTEDGEKTVYGFWDAAGALHFHYANAGLMEEIGEANPSIGDDVVLVRGDDYNFEVNGEPRTKHRYAVRSKPSSEPLPGGDTVGTPGQGTRPDDIPF